MRNPPELSERQTMGWQSDWLYRLIFDEVAILWAQARKDGAGTFGPSPDRFYVEECAAADWKELHCQPPVLRTWVFDGSIPPVLLTPSSVPPSDRTVRGMFFVDGMVQFHIGGNRNQIVWTHILGRRYGRGKVFRVQGQGQTATLERDRDFGEWVS
jgi:hypothetical protein